MSTNTGGPAFPHWDGPSGECFNGMTLRDYFAAAVMQGLFSNSNEDWGIEDAVEVAYSTADVMLKERTK